MRFLSPVLILLAACGSPGSLDARVGTPPIQRDGDAGFHQLVDEYFEEYFRYRPSEATAAGLHQYDRLLEDYSKTGIVARTAILERFLLRFDAVDPDKLSSDSVADREMVISSIRAQLLELQVLRPWQKDPGIYASGPNRSIFVLAGRNFAPGNKRLKSVIARLRLIPAALEAARVNLDNPPRIFTEIALENMPGIISYFEGLPEFFRDVANEELLAEFQAANRVVIEGLGNYREFLRNDLLPRSHGDYRIGAENLRKRLLFEEMFDVPLDRLLQIGYADLHRNQDQFQQTAARIDPRHTPRQVLATLTQDHPARDTLLETVRNGFGDLRDFIVAQKILTVPSPVLPRVTETPPYKRATSWASMDTPGPYETKAKEAYYFVTLPDSTWSAQRTQEFLESYSRPELSNLSIHEAYPGHYTQFLRVQRVPSKVRKLIGCDSNSEGWAHYGEQMMLDEGYGHGDPKLRLAQLQDALLRNARYIVAIEMHTGRMSHEEAVAFFTKEGCQTRSAAEFEVKRGAVQPLYLVYTLGKLAILKLRDDYKKLRKDKFCLQDFHDEFLKQGFPPIKLIRRAMVGDEEKLL